MPLTCTFRQRFPVVASNPGSVLATYTVPCQSPPSPYPGGSCVPSLVLGAGWAGTSTEKNRGWDVLTGAGDGGREKPRLGVTRPGCLSQLSTARSLDLSPEQVKPASSFVSQARDCSSSLLLEVVRKQRSDNDHVSAAIKGRWDIRCLYHSQVTVTYLAAKVMQNKARESPVRSRGAPRKASCRRGNSGWTQRGGKHIPGPET